MKLLIIRAGALGDTLMLMPLLNALSGHQVAILGRKPGIDYLEPYAAQCIDIERGGWHRLFSAGPDIDIHHPEADHVIAFINDNENIVLRNLHHLFTGSKINLFPPFPAPDSGIHVVLHMAYAIQSAGIYVNPETIFDEALKKPLMRSDRGAGKKIVLHPGSGSRKKNYSPDFWSDLLARIKKENQDIPMEICFLLGPAEEDMVSIFGQMAEEHGAEIYLCPDRVKLLSILGNTSLYIGHDSGVTHLAAMLGTNTIAIFKDSSVEQWCPLGPSLKIIGPDGDEENVLNKTVVEASSFLVRTID